MTTPISQLPTPPQPSDTPADFDSKAFSFLGALPWFVTQVNAFGIEVNNIGDSAYAAAQAAESSKSAAQESASSASSSASSAITSKEQAEASASAANQSKLDAAASASSAASSAQSIDTEYLRNRINHTGPINWAWASYSGTANAIVLNPAFSRSTYAVGDQLRFRATATNTAGTTINVGGLGAKAAVTVTGVALPSWYIRTDVDTVCVYDGTRFVVQRETEYGSNANGTFIKYANGVLDCWCKNNNVSPTNSFGSVFGTGSIPFTYPAIFSGVPKAVPLSNSSSGWALSGTPTLTNVDMFAVSPISGLSVSISCNLNGKWY